MDASAILEVLLQTPAASGVSCRVFASGESLHAPHLLDVEVAQVLRRYARAGALTSGRDAEALTDLADLPLHRYPRRVLLPRIWPLRHKFTPYDAAYIGLAEALGAPLLTRARALAAASAPVQVELI